MARTTLRFLLQYNPKELRVKEEMSACEWKNLLLVIENSPAEINVWSFYSCSCQKSRLITAGISYGREECSRGERNSITNFEEFCLLCEDLLLPNSYLSISSVGLKGCWRDKFSKWFRRASIFLHDEHCQRSRKSFKATRDASVLLKRIKFNDWAGKGWRKELGLEK